MDITPFARLAKLDLTPEEEKVLGPQLDGILAQFDSLSDLPSTPLGIRPGEESALREDVAQAAPNDLQNALLDCSTHKQANFIRLPSVF